MKWVEQWSEDKQKHSAFSLYLEYTVSIWIYEITQELRKWHVTELYSFCSWPSMVPRRMLCRTQFGRWYKKYVHIAIVINMERDFFGLGGEGLENPVFHLSSLYSYVFFWNVDIYLFFTYYIFSVYIFLNTVHWRLT